MFATIRKSNDGKVIMVQRSTGFAVSMREPKWNQAGRVMTHDWTLQGSHMSRRDADALFTALSGNRMAA